MSASEPAQATGRRTKLTVRAAFVVANVALVGVFIHQSLATSSFPVASPSDTRHGALADGFVPAGVKVFDDEIPGVANLDPELLAALREAATDAADDGVEFFVNSGWRSPAYQEQLLSEAVAKYGSREEAARWVATPETSPHVLGQAIDIGRSDATAWLSKYGAAYGLCQIYDNEPWHYELRPEAVDHGCPPRYADPTHDPRMQR
ncbi:peptidase M15 [Kribbella pittospori]|uniref:Peptidase M15 n=1 Tax=Kribbella pittospori TaxID=722689 RepID=A0A4R0K512_9ACTN|nr:M15 family metallopeptidase [Kribbella pittospori]TCC54237.1 peptidase M15 [Kribbella pittospori]